MASQEQRHRALSRKAHFVALISMILCLVVAIAAAQAQAKKADTPAPTCNKVGIVTVCPSFSTVKVSFTTPKPTSASVSTSMDKSFGLTVLDKRVKKVHSITVPENPGKTYNIKVVATPSKGKPSTYLGSFQTGAIGSMPATVTTLNGKFLLNGVPFFPIVAQTGSCLDATWVNALVGMGVNALQDARGCSTDTTAWSNELDPLLKNLAWVYGSKPDTAQYLQAVPEFLTWQAHLRLLQNPLSLVSCDSSFASSKPLYVAVKNSAKKGPTMFTVLAVGQITPSSRLFCLDGAGMKNLFFISIIGGVKALDLFTFIPVTGAMDVKSDVSQAAAQAAACMDTIGPAILNGKPVTVKFDPKGQVVASAWLYGGVTYVITANTEKTATSSSLSVPSLIKATTATTLCEPLKTIKLSRGSITGNYGPLGVHIYKVLPTKA